MAPGLLDLWTRQWRSEYHALLTAIGKPHSAGCVPVRPSHGGVCVKFCALSKPDQLACSQQDGLFGRVPGWSVLGSHWVPQEMGLDAPGFPKALPDRTARNS